MRGSPRIIPRHAERDVIAGGGDGDELRETGFTAKPQRGAAVGSRRPAIYRLAYFHLRINESLFVRVSVFWICFASLYDVELDEVKVQELP